MLHITDHTSHGVNKGKGGAVRTLLGYAAEHGFDALVLLDGDGQHDLGEIPGGLVVTLRKGITEELLRGKGLNEGQIKAVSDIRERAA